MLPSKPRSSFSDNSNNKTVPATPKSGVKTGRVSLKSESGTPKSTKSESGTPSPVQKSRISLKSVESKPTVEGRSPKFSTTTPDKQSRALKASEVQAQLNESLEDLKKVKEQLASTKLEKARVLEELNDARKLADEANEKLKEALAAQKRAEESSEIEKFRADELEQAGIEASQKREDEWGKEIESVKQKHCLDVDALLSTTQDLEMVKNELEATTKIKITALSQADDAMRVAEINAEKAEHLSDEVSRLKSLLDLKVDSANRDTEDVIKKLECEVDSLRHELERAKEAEEKVILMESLSEQLRADADNAKSAELDSHKLVDEWKKKAEYLETQVMVAKQSEMSTLEFLASVTEKLEECNASLLDSELETSALREKVGLLEDQLVETRQTEKSSLESQASLAKQLEVTNASLQDAESETSVLKGKVESLEIEVANVRKAELDSGKLADEWKNEAESLKIHLTEVNQSKESLLESLASITKQLGQSNSSLHDALSEVTANKEKIASLEFELTRSKEELLDYERCLDVAQQEAIEMGKSVKGLKSEIHILEEEKSWALDSAKAAASDAERLSEERDQLIKELEMSGEEEEKAKKAMEGLTSALHEMSVEARETQERLIAKSSEHEDAYAQIEQLKLAICSAEENYETMLDKARGEIDCLKKAIETLEIEAKEKQAEWDAKEFNFVGVIKGSEEELVSLKAKIGNMENGVEDAKDDVEEMLAKLSLAESRVSCANDAVEEAKVETQRVKERLLDRENELQNISQENAELRIREAASIEKVSELSALLVEATCRKFEDNGELLNIEKDQDLHENSKECSVESVSGNKEEDTMSGEDLKLKEDNTNGHQCSREEESVEHEAKVPNEGESINDERSLKRESSSFNHPNGLPSETTEDGVTSPTKQQQQKKKKPLLQKFGSLLKKKSPHK